MSIDDHTRARAFLLRQVAALLSCLAIFAATPLAARVSVGTAYSLEDDRVLYLERRTEHWREGDLIASEVEYLTPDGELFAAKSIRFDGDGTAPEFTFVDFREEFREGARLRTGEVELFSGPADDLERRRTRLPAAPVIDAGFDVLVAREFERLAAGEQVGFDFAVPALQRFVRFQVDKVGELDYRGTPALELRMRPANPLLRLLVDPIRLVYDHKRRLREFAGISDIRDDSGERHLARIVFDYAPDGADAPVVLGAG